MNEDNTQHSGGKILHFELLASCPCPSCHIQERTQNFGNLICSWNDMFFFGIL